MNKFCETVARLLDERLFEGRISDCPALRDVWFYVPEVTL